MLRHSVSAAIAVLLVGSIAGVSAQEPAGVAIHGFGGWTFGDTDVNRFLGSGPEGEFSKSNFAVKLTANTEASVQVHAQFFFRNAFDGSTTSLDYAFADWRLDNALGVRVGKVKHPFGIYSEVTGLGTVRPFLNLPQAVYGPIALVSKSYRGVGVGGSIPFGVGWTLEYDVYGGGIEFEQEESALAILTSPAADSTVGGRLFESREVIGSRVTVQAPFDGLKVGVSAYSGRPESLDPNADRYYTLGGQAEYVANRTWVRSEVVYQRDRATGLNDRETAYYLEVAQFLGDHWQVATQLSRLSLDISLPPPVVLPEDFREHEELALGLNYWVSPQLGFKASVHWVRGNLIAELGQADLQQIFLTGISPQPETRLLQLGAQFSF